MFKTILVIGSVTSKQYSPLRMQINLLGGSRAKVVRPAHDDFIDWTDDFDPLMHVDKFNELVKQRVGMSWKKFKKHSGYDKQTLDRIENTFDNKTYEFFWAQTFERLGHNSADFLLLEEDLLIEMMENARMYLEYFLSRLSGAEAWVSTPEKLVGLQDWCRQREAQWLLSLLPSESTV